LHLDVDPFNQLLETIESDNSSCIAIRLAGTTTRTVQVLGGCGGQTGVSISSISPNRLKQGTSATVTVTGSGFAQGMTLGFENGSGPAPTVKSVTVVNSTTLMATVSVKAGGPKTIRLWDVRVSSAVLPRGFTVEP
jgi:hypothetical protein